MDTAPVLDPIIKGKASKRYVRTAFFICFILNALITHGPNWINSLKSNKPDPPVLGKTVSVGDLPKPSNEPVKENTDSCVLLTPLDKYNIETKFKFLNLKDNYYIPNGAGNSWEGIVWIKKALSLGFKSIFIEYEVISSTKKDKPPSIIWQIAQSKPGSIQQEIFKIWTPEFSERQGNKYLQILGLAKNRDFSQNDVAREPGLELPDPVKVGQTDSLEITSTSINGNEMSVTILYRYTSDRTGMGISYSNASQIKFPYSNLENTNEKLDIGIGSFYGNKFRIVTLKICY